MLPIPRRRRATASLPDKVLHVDLAPGARQIVRNLLVHRDGVVEAGYRIGPARWDFLGEAAQQMILDQTADVWATLAGRDMRERVTTRPHPVHDWARRLDRRTPHPAPDIAGETWNDHLARMQRRISEAGMDDKVVYRYFTVGRVDPEVDVRAQVLALIGDGIMPCTEVRRTLAEEKRVADAVTGWNARRMTEREAAWLRLRSLAPGMPAPMIEGETGWDEGDLPALAADVRWHETPWDRTVEVHGWRNGKELVTHVQTLTCARLDDMNYPHNGLEPWQAYAERVVGPDGYPFSVEWSIVGRIHEGSELTSESERNLRKAMHAQEHYHDHAEPPPAATQRGIDRAAITRDEVTTGQTRQAARFRGTISMIVTGPTPEVTEERAAAIRRLYEGSAMRMLFVPTPGQAYRLQETIPGEKFDRMAYQRQITLDYLAAGLPNVSGTVGDDSGPYLGHTLGSSRRPVMHDPHFATEGRGELGRGNNMWVGVGSLGSGKSVLADVLAYNASRRGIRVVIRDPSGPMMALCRMPELQGVATAVDLLRGERGILSPPALVRDPRKEEFQDPDIDAARKAYEEAVEAAQAERQALVVDIARRSLEADLYQHPGTLSALRAAARAVKPWKSHHTLWDLIDALHHGDEHSHILADALTDASQMPMLSLLFPPEGQGGDFRSVHNNSVLTVISTPGVRRAPDETERFDWSPAELAADPVLRLTSYYTDRALFAKRMSDRAIAIFDEAEDLTDSGTGRGYLSRLGRDHSKHNIAVYLMLKSISDDMLSGELRNFLAGAFVGRMANQRVAETMLDILNIGDKAYARSLMRLSETSPGEFIHLDAEGRVGGIKVDVDYYPPLRDAVLTNPTPEGSDAWGVDR